MQSRVMEKSKVLYNLDEILQNGYSIKTKIPEETRCKYCNKVLKPRGDIKSNKQNNKCIYRE